MTSAGNFKLDYEFALLNRCPSKAESGGGTGGEEAAAAAGGGGGTPTSAAAPAAPAASDPNSDEALLQVRTRCFVALLAGRGIFYHFL